MRQLRLMEESVKQQLDSLDIGYDSASRSARLQKISWKKVAEYILNHGGTYFFGNATCKKKWVESFETDRRASLSSVES